MARNTLLAFLLLCSSALAQMPLNNAYMRDSLDANEQAIFDLRYLNFTGTEGSAGVGIRINNGVLEFKNVGDPGWTPIGDAGAFDTSSIDTSAELRAILTDELGTGALVFNNPTNFQVGSSSATAILTLWAGIGAGNFVTLRPDGLAGSQQVTFPNASGVMVLDTAGQALANKEISGTLNTITNLNAGTVFSSGLVPTARLGAGTADSNVYLRGDQTWQLIDDDHVAFDDADNVFAATTVGGALEELNNSINAGVPNGTGAKVNWSQLVDVPAGFADGTDGGGGGGSIATTPNILIGDNAGAAISGGFLATDVMRLTQNQTVNGQKTFKAFTEIGQLRIGSGTGVEPLITLDNTSSPGTPDPTEISIYQNSSTPKWINSSASVYTFASLEGTETFSGQKTIVSPVMVYPETAMPALEIDVAKTDQTKTIAAPTTFTLIGTSVDGQVFGMWLTNSDSVPHLQTLPAGTWKSSARGGAVITNFTMPAASTVYISAKRQSAGVYRLDGEPVTINDMDTEPNPASTDFIAGHDTSLGRDVKFPVSALSGGGGSGAGNTNTGTHASPTTTNPLNLTYTGDENFLYYNAAGVVNLPAAASYTNRPLTVYSVGANIIEIDPSGTEVIVRDGTAQAGGTSILTAAAAGNYVKLVSDGTRWITQDRIGAISVGNANPAGGPDVWYDAFSFGTEDATQLIYTNQIRWTTVTIATGGTATKLRIKMSGFDVGAVGIKFGLYNSAGTLLASHTGTIAGYETNVLEFTLASGVAVSAGTHYIAVETEIGKVMHSKTGTGGKYESSGSYTYSSGFPPATLPSSAGNLNDMALGVYVD